ncbi:MAG: hypothetical protein ABS46_07100 [Cytophagaceae bacterium SCN 52-12]|nr:MAG: hypothetical protein ABS46_07100 [Cytophagaceae bacterium SCN 52-12]
MSLYSTDTELESGLWLRFKSGDRRAFAEMYERYAGVLYNYGFHITNERHIVEDAIQDLFVTLWQSRERLSDTTSIKYYLFRSLRRQIVRLSGKDALMERLGQPDFLSERQQEPSIEMQLMESESEQYQLRVLRTALLELSPRQLEAIRLHFFEGFDYGSIARIMEMNEQSVRNLLQRSIYKLRHVMYLFPLLFLLFRT